MQLILLTFFCLCQTELVLTYSFSFWGDTLFRIYCVKLFIGIFRIIIVVVKERFEMMRGLWRSMLVSSFFFLISQAFFFFSLFLFSFFLFSFSFLIVIKLFLSNSQTETTTDSI